MFEKMTVQADDGGIAKVTEYVRKKCEAFGIPKKELEKTVLASEESVGILIAHAKEAAEITVRIRSLFGKMHIELSAKGERFALKDHVDQGALFGEEVGEAAQDMIRAILLKAMSESIRLRHIHGGNRITIRVQRNRKAFLVQTLGAMALAIVTGLILASAAPAAFNTGLDTYVLVPVKTVYMNALKMVVAPVVFFSIVSCIVRFTDLSELGRVGGRVLSLYLFTTFLAVFVGIGVFFLFQPGSQLPTADAIASAKEITSKTVDVSVKDLIVGIVPSDFVQPFVESNMLQLIFLAVICGIAAGLIGRYSEPVKNAFEAFNELFLKITTIIIRFMPFAIFASICSMMLNMGIGTVLSLFGIFATFVFGLFCMMTVYTLLILIVGRVNPLPFLRKYPSTMLQVFSMASSNASIPINLKACERLGIAQKIYSLSVPLGATVNMDGTCVYMAVFALALAKTYGVELTGASLTGLILSIVVLSIGAPGIPGSGLICLSVLLTQIGVPTEAVGLVMGIDSLVGMFRCMSNCTGDVAVSVMVAKREGALDMERYGGDHGKM
ncbi:MAG: dicarboxylate/amino acid:cation symporter [Lachnospiraceae bacterium]|nr:dicarboxylate/amino acid:cation symporter [Lachnospiraceae bacterium]